MKLELACRAVGREEARNTFHRRGGEKGRGPQRSHVALADTHHAAVGQRWDPLWTQRRQPPEEDLLVMLPRCSCGCLWEEESLLRTNHRLGDLRSWVLELSQAHQAREQMCWASSSSLNKTVLWEELVREGDLG